MIRLPEKFKVFFIKTWKFIVAFIADYINLARTPQVKNPFLKVLFGVEKVLLLLVFELSAIIWIVFWAIVCVLFVYCFMILNSDRSMFGPGCSLITLN